MNFFSFYLFSAIKGNNIEDAVQLIENNRGTVRNPTQNNLINSLL